MIIISVGRIEKEILRLVSKIIKEKFGIKSKIVEVEIETISKAFDEKRNQYRGKEIIEILSKKFKEKILGILNADVYEDGLNFIFGEAQLFGKVAFVSIFRLNPKFYGIENRELFLERIEKEVTHELGHLFGLSHCERKCVMRFSNSIYEVDEKSKSFCKYCEGKLKKFLKFKDN